MELKSQIKKYRSTLNLSQEELAEKLFVSRQTISNWENEKSYPDVHNLMMMSALFHVSIDELVKGDKEILKKRVEENHWNFWANLMTIASILAGFVFVPAMLQGSIILFVIAALIYCIALFSSFKIEILKRKFHIKTYKQVIDFLEGKEIRKKSSVSDFIITYLSFPLIIIVICLLSYFIFNS